MLNIDVIGMSCGSCVARLEKALGAVPGVRAASVNLATGRASVQGTATPESVVGAIEKAGYEGRVVEASAAPTEDSESAVSALTAIGLALPLAVLSMGQHVSSTLHHQLGDLGWLGFLLSSLVVLGPGRGLLRSGARSLWRRTPDMNSLVLLGAGSAWLYSSGGWLLGIPGSDYFEAAAVILALILLGRYFESRARARTAGALRELLALTPRTSRVRRGEDLVEVPSDRLAPGEEMVVRPGERIATDGEVLEGGAYVDESMLTGEPVPVWKGAGSEVVGGTVSEGALVVRVSRVGEETVLAGIVRSVSEAQGSKLPVQALVDKVAGVFVPVVIGLALLTFAVWLAFGPGVGAAVSAAVTVLIIACPCAMGLATPTSVMVGVGRAARLGLLFRSGEAVQAMSDVRVVALDKTGTLTMGQPTLVESSVDDPTLVLAASVEAMSEHPLARAVVRAAQERGLALRPVEGFEAVVGAGVRGRVGGVLTELGSARFLGGGEGPEGWAERALSVISVRVEGQVVGYLGISDPVKESASSALAELRRTGRRVVVLTGDREATARATERGLEVDEVRAELSPADKASAVEELRAAYGPVLFVGDGINDAPALAQADVGMALGTGTDVAAETAGVVLMSGDLRGVGRALRLSGAMMRNIRQNLFWAFLYNALLIPVAAGALYPTWGVTLSPMLASAAMAFSSLFVVGNALRLARWGRLEGARRAGANLPA